MNKYHVSLKEARTYNGKTYASKREMQVAMEFILLKKAGEIIELEEQPTIELIPKPNRITYRPDFRIVWRNGNEEWIDVKGHPTDVFKLKKKIFHHFHPDKKLVIMR